jgi:hypothetical protein
LRTFQGTWIRMTFVRAARATTVFWRENDKPLGVSVNLRKWYEMMVKLRNE